MNKKLVGAALASYRNPNVKGKCKASDCLKDFTGLSTKKYCGNRCKQQAKNERNKVSALKKMNENGLI